MATPLKPCRRGVGYLNIARGLVWERRNADGGIGLLKRAIDESKAYMKALPNRETLGNIEDAYSALMTQYGFEGTLGSGGHDMSSSFRLIMEKDRFLARYETEEMQAKMDNTEHYFSDVNAWYAEAVRLAEGDAPKEEKEAFLQMTEKVLDEAFGNEKSFYLLEHAKELSPILNVIEAELMVKKTSQEQETDAAPAGLADRIRGRIEGFLEERLSMPAMLETPSDLEYLVHRFVYEMADRPGSSYGLWF